MSIDPPASVDAMRAALAEASTTLREGLRRGEGGARLLHAYAATVGRLVGTMAAPILERADARFGSLALVALGGLGRHELAPGSDLDLALLADHPSEGDVEFDAVVRSLVHPLWDLGLRVNVIVHAPSTWLAQAESDLSLCTALLDLRWLAGDRERVEALRRDAFARFFGPAREPFLRRLADEVKERHARYGGTVYTVEPDLKLGPGGTRDLATVRWCLRATHGSDDLTELAAHGKLPARLAELIVRARDVLFRQRAVLQIVAKRAQDRLVFQYQEQLPVELGFVPEGPIDDATLVQAIERAMQDYYRSARDVLRYGRRICERCRLGATEAVASRRIDERFGIGDGRLVHDRASLFAETPVLALDALALRRDKAVELSGETFDAIAEAMALPASRALADEPEAQRRFLDLLVAPDDFGLPTALELASELRLLERVVPEWGPIRGRMQHEGYHVYTVDQHTLNAVAMLKRLARGEHNKDYPLATALHLEIDDPRVLYLAALVHDAGKAVPGDQCESGSIIAREVATRAGLSDGDARRCALLVGEHLTMPLLSQKRDLSDPLLVAEFAKTVGDRETLKELYLLSLVDMAQVRPGNLTSWKLTLLDEAYLQTCAHLRRGRMRSAPRLRRPGEPLGFPDRYYSLYHFDLRRHHAALVERLVGEHRQALLDVASGSGALRLTLAAKDRAGLLAQTTAIVDDHGLEVMAADVFSAPGPPAVALDVFRVVSKQGPAIGLDAATVTAMEQALQRGLDREALRQPPPARRRAAWRRGPRVATRVAFDTDPSGQRTIVEIETEAGSDVLRRITLAFAAEGADIEVARCNAELDRASNVFYVPLLAESAQRSLAERLRSYLA